MASPDERRPTQAQSISLDIVLKALPTVAIAQGLSVFGVKAVVVAAVIGPLLAEAIKQLVRRRNWGARKTLPLAGVFLLFAQFDGYVARALRRLFGGHLPHVATVHSGATTVAATCAAATGVALAAVVPPTVSHGTAETRPSLVMNGDAEQSPAATEGEEVAKPSHWRTSGSFTALAYDAGGSPDPDDSQAIGGGEQYFAGGPENERSTATQVVDISRFAAAVDAGNEQAEISAALGGWSSQRDHAIVTATFLDGSGQALGQIRIGPVTADQRSDETTLLERRAAAPVPPRTRSVRIVVVAIRFDGQYNDGYADNIGLSLSPLT